MTATSWAHARHASAKKDEIRRESRSGRDFRVNPLAQQLQLELELWRKVERAVGRCGRGVNGDAAIETWAVAAEDVFLRLGSTRPSWSRRRCRCWRTPRGGR